MATICKLTACLSASWLTRPWVIMSENVGHTELTIITTSSKVFHSFFYHAVLFISCVFRPFCSHAVKFVLLHREGLFGPVMSWTVMKYMLFIGSRVFLHDVAADRSWRIHSEQMLQKLKMLVLWCTCTMSKNIINCKCEIMSLCKSVFSYHPDLFHPAKFVMLNKSFVFFNIQRHLNNTTPCTR